MYNRGGEFLIHEFINSLIEQEYVIKTKPASSGNPQSNETIDWIHQVLGNLIFTYILHDTYVDDADPWMVILVTASFTVRYTYHWNKQTIPGQLVLAETWSFQ